MKSDGVGGGGGGGGTLIRRCHANGSQEKHDSA